MQAIVFDKSALPTEVLQLREVERPRPGPGEVLVKMLSAPINPGDFLFIQSLYPDPKKPSLPGQIAGNSGAGVVVEKGPGASLAIGTLVDIYYYNTWAAYVAVPEEWAIPLPVDYPREKAGQLMTLITGWDLVEASGARPGDWMVITAGNSSNAVMATQMAARKGIRVISIVRKMPAGLDLRALGAAAVIDLSVTGETVGPRIREITGGKGVNAIIEAVGGPVLTELVQSAGFGAKVILYGGLSELPFQLHNGDIYLKGLMIESYVYRYFFRPPAPEERETIRRIIDLSSDPSFIMPVSGRYDLEEYSTAVQNSFYSSPGSTAGKTLFSMG
ncbi:zinc-binding dehydrogenase [Flavitalea sp. BT771]|uniref:quinone oxidoreductase family protein n=1 Tax=Flavitalea sp. BT771 TaxID=3063329 RepID=UPI0026E25EBB|nr:zinc-binding dehydrogenase [Flavitalea sp. BT771]MDO6435156.1 zinc-binding dehydrogenase [Flavitalea sp. BT771]MDV6224139.1 zinc-binding dehydrogenase [Flavitalea sp. BT771]